MNKEQINKVTDKAWELANEPYTDFEACVALKDCAIVIKELQSRLESLEKDAARYRWLRDHFHGFEHYLSELAIKLNMFEHDIEKAMKG